MSVKEQITKEILLAMSGFLSKEQLDQLEITLHLKLKGIVFSAEERGLLPVDNTNEDIIRRFVASKSIEGLSEKSIKQYVDTIYWAINTLKKSVYTISSDDIKLLMAMKLSGGASRVTVDNYRRYLRSFFNWMSDEEIRIDNPTARVKQIKMGKVVKKAFTMEDLEKMRNECSGNLRDRALLEVLLCTAARVSEIVSLNREDIRWDEREAVVLGKGNKERIIYFSETAIVHLKRYMESREDKEQPLFVAVRKPYKRLSSSSIEVIIRKIGTNAGVKAHPHKFRRTEATLAAQRGMPIEQIQRMLGHSQIGTTMLYTEINQTSVKNSHQRLLQ